MAESAALHRETGGSGGQSRGRRDTGGNMGGTDRSGTAVRARANGGKQWQQ